MPIEREGFETVGGFLLSHLGHVPAIGETFDIDGLHVEVIDAERRRVRKVRITHASRQEADENERPATRERGARGRRARATDMKSGFVSLDRPPQRRQVLPPEPHHRRKARHRLRQAPDDAHTAFSASRTTPDGQVVFVDTPGIHRPLHRMNVRMVDSAVETSAKSTSSGWSSTDRRARRRPSLSARLVKDTKAKTILILNKIDLVKKHKLLPMIDQLSKERDWHAIVPVSASDRRQRRRTSKR